MILTRRFSQPIWTFVFIAASVLGFIFQQTNSLWVYFVFIPAYAARFPWMLVTSIFFHTDLNHLVFNMFALYFFGSHLERMIGGRVYASLFLLSGIVGNLGYMATASSLRIPALGASGAIYGVIGSLAILAPLMIVLIYGLVPIPMIAAAFLWALMDFLGLFIPSGIAHGAHLSGMLVGAVVGLYIRLRMRWSVGFVRY